MIINNLLKIFRSKFLILKQIVFIFKIKLYKTKNTNVLKLIDKGYIHLEKCFPTDLVKQIALKHYSKINKESVVDHVLLDKSDKEKILLNLKKLNILKISKEYLGEKLICYGWYKYLGAKKSFEESWQPHHDTKLNRLKIYVWISKKDLNTHPLYYSKGTHKKIKYWSNYEDTRYPVNNLKFDEIYGDTGDVIIFDTHGIHSNFKKSQKKRECFEITLESYGIFKRLNLRSKKGLVELNRLNAEVLTY